LCLNSFPVISYRQSQLVYVAGSGLGSIYWRLITVLGDLFLSANFGVKMVMVTMNKVVRASEVESADSQAALLTETALLTLGEIAASSDKVEGEVSISVRQ
jgi:hypothetical protein